MSRKTTIQKFIELLGMERNNRIMDDEEYLQKLKDIDRAIEANKKLLKWFK
jgi:hypothetical protein